MYFCFLYFKAYRHGSYLHLWSFIFVWKALSFDWFCLKYYLAVISSKLIFSWSFTHSITHRACTSVRNRIVVDVCMRTFYLFVWNPDMATQYTLVSSCLGQWSDDAMVRWRRDGKMTQDGTTVRWRWCDDTSMMQWYDSDEAMIYRTIVIASSHYRYRVFAPSFQSICWLNFKINAFLKCIISKTMAAPKTITPIITLDVLWI